MTPDCLAVDVTSALLTISAWTRGCLIGLCSLYRPKLQQFSKAAFGINDEVPVASNQRGILSCVNTDFMVRGSLACCADMAQDAAAQPCDQLFFECTPRLMRPVPIRAFRVAMVR